MKVLETTYSGYRFRSRLEARWAVFFDQCGISYLYEPEAYDLARVQCLACVKQCMGLESCCCAAVPSLQENTGYIPDFFLKNVGLRSMDSPGVFFEVKGIYDEHADAKALALGHLTRTPVVMATIAPMLEMEEGIYQIFPWWDNYMVFMRCITCHRTKIEFAESNYMYCSSCGAGADDEHPVLVKAASKARSWRFEPRKERTR